jgi:DNA polymerase III delta subunit
MLYLFHGDSTKDSRVLLISALEKEKAAGHEIRTFDGEKITPRDLESTLNTASLFSQESLVIENLLSRLRSKDKDACLVLIKSYVGNKNIFLWEKKEITKAHLANLPTTAKVSNSRAPMLLFNWLETVYPGNLQNCLTLLHQVTAVTEDILVFTMLARQISYLIMMKSATSPKFAPWQMGKLRAQSAKWAESALQAMLYRLLEIDEAVKTGQTKLTFADHLDILLVNSLG